MVATATRTTGARQTADLPLAAKLHAHVASAIARGKPDAAAKVSDDLDEPAAALNQKTETAGRMAARAGPSGDRSS